MGTGTWVIAKFGELSIYAYLCTHKNGIHLNLNPHTYGHMTNDKKRTSPQFCLLSRAEAAAMLGCSCQTISNWVKSGVLKGRHVGKRLYLAKESVEYIRDNASDVLAMEQKLKAMKKEQEEEIALRDQEITNLRETKNQLVQKKFIHHVLESMLVIAKEKLSDKELMIASGLLEGKTMPEMGAEMGYTGERIRQFWQEIEPVLLEQIDFPAIREENQMLRNENAQLKEENEKLTAKIHELQRPRDFLSTPFNTDISKLGLTINSQIGLSELGCKNLGDLVQLDAMTVRRTRKLGPTVAFRIEEQLKTMGLHFGMDLIHMSDKDFDDLVHRLQKMSELT